MMFLKYNVETSYDEDSIKQVVSRVDIQGHTEKVFQSVARLQDQGVQDALIALGWTPPQEENPNQCNMSDLELPGMWESSDFEGGETDGQISMSMCATANEYYKRLMRIQAKEIVYLRARVAELEEEYKRLELNWLDQVERAEGELDYYQPYI